MHRGTWLGEKNKVNGRSTMVSTLTHTTREVAIDFLRWREEQKQTNNGFTRLGEGLRQG